MATKRELISLACIASTQPEVKRILQKVLAESSPLVSKNLQVTAAVSEEEAKACAKELIANKALVMSKPSGNFTETLDALLLLGEEFAPYSCGGMSVVNKIKNDKRPLRHPGDVLEKHEEAIRKNAEFPVYKGSLVEGMMGIVRRGLKNEGKFNPQKLRLERR